MHSLRCLLGKKNKISVSLYSFKWVTAQEDAWYGNKLIHVRDVSYLFYYLYSLQILQTSLGRWGEWGEFPISCISWFEARVLNQTTPIATSQDILQNCSTERWDIYNYVLPINNSINRTFLFRYRGDKNNCDEGKNKSSWVQTDRFNTCQSLWLPKYSPRHRRRFLEEKASTYTALHHTASL